MSVAEQVGADLPYLRRYARALSGSQSTGDAYVRATLEAALADDALRDEIGQGRVPLYAAFTRIWSSSHVETAEPEPGQGRSEEAVQSRLATIPPTHRQALLLTTLEEFSNDDAAKILGITTNEVEALVAQAVREIDSGVATDVLIIEDEPLIAMQLEEIVTDLGHTVTGTAATHSKAVELFSQKPAGLVLADIQLADGSSGIDAVEELLAIGDVPVIFVSAYPERLLTGERPEPTYLVTKPFREETVRAAIGQALFFHSNRRSK
jgi:DNA-directed RNA polymerase specialized sigma24 family protein/CheY-like chemotaxis protein